MNLCGKNDEAPLNYHEHAKLINVLLGQGRLGEVEQELHKIFDKGYHHGLNNGWAIEQDKDDTNGFKGNF